MPNEGIGKWELEIGLNSELTGLNEVYRDIAQEIGIENMLVIFRAFHGTQVSFPTRLFSKEYLHETIVREYDGTNTAQLAQKYNYSERSIQRILKSNKTNHLEEP